MVREAWCLRVPKVAGEKTRRKLLEGDLLDPDLLIRHEGDFLLLPLREACEGCEKGSFKEIPAKPELPRHEFIGGIAVSLEDDRAGAERLLSSRPSLHTVLFPEGPVEGEFRTRRFKVLAGIPTTKTRYTEYGLLFEIDLSLAYFSPRLSAERQRVLSRVTTGERILDMFAGVGPFSITLAQRASVVYGADKNPAAVSLMIENIILNRSGNVLPTLADAGRLPGILPSTFDRIVMNLPFGAVRFLDTALHLCRKGGAIHLYALVEEEGALLPTLEERGCEFTGEHVVHTYSPSQWLAVYDLVAG